MVIGAVFGKQKNKTAGKLYRLLKPGIGRQVFRADAELVVIYCMKDIRER